MPTPDRNKEDQQRNNPQQAPERSKPDTESQPDRERRRADEKQDPNQPRTNRPDQREQGQPRQGTDRPDRDR
jgi:hypothetical protein